MGVKITVDGKLVPVGGYRVSQSSMPVAGGDSSGAVGSIDLDMGDPRGVQVGPYIPLGKEVDFIDSSRGSTRGTVRSVTTDRGGDFPYSVSANDRLGEFNIESQVQPYVGTLQGAFEYYCGIANIDTDISIDPALATRPVNFVGWNGNLWYNMKQMAIGVGCDLNLISNVVVLRPLRKFVALSERETNSSFDVDGTQLALKQEVIWYDTKYVANGLVYPAGGWNSEVRPISVNAGETVEFPLETNASIMSLQQPTCVPFMAPEYSGASAYTVVGDDNEPILPLAWTSRGGRVTVRASDDTLSVIATVTAPLGIVQVNGEPVKTFRLALPNGVGTDTFASLRVVGQFVERNRQSIIIPTGVAEWRTGQEFAPTIDNYFLNTLDQAYSAGVRGARQYTGRSFSLSANVTAVNRRGERGTANYPPYSFVQTRWDALSYGGVKSLNAGKTYSQVRAELYALVQDSFDNQIFGNVPGARYWDRKSARWYRVRSATTGWGDISIQADDDLLIGDMKTLLAGRTYGQVRTKYTGMNYYEANLIGATP